MSLPSFPGGEPGQGYPSAPGPSAATGGADGGGLFDWLPVGGNGRGLPVWLLACCGAFTAVATGVSIMSITLQLKNYRKPALQRAVVRIMVMVPLYAISSLIALYSLEAAFFIDAVRDLYEAFVIYTFFQLLITYLGGERSLLLILHGRQPIDHPFPFGIFLSPMDISDPWTLLNLKRGVLQYVQIKPVLVVATIILKATGTYREGDFAWDSGYTYISVVYNTSICLSLYCLAMFWVCVSDDLKPFRPLPKFLCVKGILFFSFWQSIGVSFLVAVHAIKQVGPYTDAEHMSLALVDSLICFEMPIFAIAHQYAFQSSDYIDDELVHTARLPFIYAFRDAFGLKDVWQDTKDTFKGSGISYQAYEPAEGSLHYGAGRQKRIRAGLRYSRGGQSKYWLPIPGDEARYKGERGPLTAIRHRLDERLAQREGYAPLLQHQAERVVRPDPRRGESYGSAARNRDGEDDSDSDAASLDFESVGEEEEAMYVRARRIGYAGFPNVDVTKENRRRRKREEEDGILAGKWTRGAGGRGEVPAGRSRGGSGSNGVGRGKGKEPQRGGRGYYGGFADRQSSVEPESASHDHGTVSGPPGEQAGSVRLYDGDAERPDAWRANGHADAEAMRWTSKAGKGKSAPVRRSQQVRQNSNLAPSDSGNKKPSRPTSPFSLGSASDGDAEPPSDPDPDEPVRPASRPLPSDAVDLVVEDDTAREDAREHERRKGEPQAFAPAHVYVAQRTTSDMRVDRVQEVYSPGMAVEQVQAQGRGSGLVGSVSPAEVGGGGGDGEGALWSMGRTVGVRLEGEPGVGRGGAKGGDEGAKTGRRKDEVRSGEGAHAAGAPARYGSLYDQEENPWA